MCSVGQRHDVGLFYDCVDKRELDIWEIACDAVHRFLKEKTDPDDEIVFQLRKSAERQFGICTEAWGNLCEFKSPFILRFLRACVGGIAEGEIAASRSHHR